MNTVAPEFAEIAGMTADTICVDLLSAVVTEIKLLPDVWQKLSENKQQDIIDRLRKRVETNVRMSVHLIASQGRKVVVGDLESVAIKDGIKATLKVSAGNESRHDLFDSVVKACLLVVSEVGGHLSGMDAVQASHDQSPLDLVNDDENFAHYKEDGGVVDAEIKELPALGLNEDDHDGSEI